MKPTSVRFETLPILDTFFVDGEFFLKIPIRTVPNPPGPAVMMNAVKLSAVDAIIFGNGYEVTPTQPITSPDDAGVERATAG